MKIRLTLLLLTLSPILSSPGTALPISIEQIVSMALQSNPQVRATRARWSAAEHAVVQNYVPDDPIFTYESLDSPTNGIDHASEHIVQGSESFQFPGKGYLQGNIARRKAQIARLTYEAAVRDVRARTEIQYYQLAIDSALTKNVRNTIGDLERFRSRIGPGDTEYLDAISANLADATQRRRRFEIAQADDETRLNELLNRRPDEPLNVEAALDLHPIAGRVDELIERAWSRRQEILEAALHEENAEAALTLAKLEYAPDYTVGYAFNHYILESAAPAPNLTQTHNIWISFNLPLFFWIKQNEDIKRAGFDSARSRFITSRPQVVTKPRNKSFGPFTDVNTPHCHPVNSGATTALVAGNLPPGAPQIAEIGHPIPQLAIAAVRIIPAPLIEIALNAEEPSLIGSIIRVHGCFLRPHRLSAPCPPLPSARFSRAPTTTRAPPLDAIISGLRG